MSAPKRKPLKRWVLATSDGRWFGYGPTHFRSKKEALYWRDRWAPNCKQGECQGRCPTLKPVKLVEAK